MAANHMCPAQRTCDNVRKETTVDSLRTAGRAAARVGSALGLAATILLTGCHNFFLCQKASCPSSGGSGGTATTDFVYVSGSSTGSTYITGYDISKGALTTLGSPDNLDYQPVAMNISPNDQFLYIASIPGASNAGIYVYTIDSTGHITGPNGGGVLISGAIASMDISPDGGYLFALSDTGLLMTEYKADTSTGSLQLVTSFQLPGLTCALPINAALASQTCTVKASPTGDFVVVSLGTAGTVIFPFTSSSGITTASYTTIPSGSTSASPSGDYSVALDASRRVYIARTNAVAVWQINDAQGDAVQLSSTSFNSGVTPRSVVLANSYGDVYTANEGTGTISGYSINATTGALTAISGAPFAGPANVSALGVDKSGSYMVAAGYNSSSGVQIFSISSTGALTLGASAGAGTATAYPVVLAMSH